MERRARTVVSGSDASTISNVWSAAKKKEKLHYMHANPVKEGLVAHPKDWPWSSFCFYAYDRKGLLRIDPVD